LLLAGLDPNFTNARGKTTLMFVVAKCPSIAAMQVLLDAGADVNLRCQDGESALSYAIQAQRDPEIFQLLFQAGAELIEVSFLNVSTRLPMPSLPFFNVHKTT
jgi:ankyrin repeat protein